jgi:dinuclear metal center YbgI/SA1388 family protein
VAGRDELIRFLDELLEADAYRDYGPNGLQVIGAPEVAKVCSAVSASLDVFTRAAAAGAQLVLVHHGLFWDGTPRTIGRLERARLEALFRHDLSLVAYHLPLDGHAELGNNALLARLLGIESPEPFAEHGGRPLGRMGALPVPVPASAVAEALEAALGVRGHLFAGGPPLVHRLGVVSGGAAGSVREAAALGLDAFVTGEPAEESPYLAAELGIHLIAAGHNATETVGVRALGERLAARFGVAHEFLPVANPV